MGEGLPYWMSGMDYPWLKPAGGKTVLSRRPSEYVTTNFDGFVKSPISALRFISL